MYQNGLVRLAPQADAIRNRVGFAVIEAAVIPRPEEICSEMCPRILGLALMTATPCAFVGNAPVKAVSHSLSAIQLPTDAELERPTKHQKLRYSSPLGVSVPGAPGPTFASGSTYPVACAARQNNPLAFIIALKRWSLSEAEE